MKRSYSGAGAWPAMKMIAVGALALAALLVYAPALRAAEVPLGGGETRIVLDDALVKELRQAGVSVKVIGPAKLKGRRLALPVKSGDYDPGAASGIFVQAGGLKLSSAGNAVALRRLTLDSTAESLSASVGGKKIKLARLAGAKLERDGFGARLKAKRMQLSGSGATALNRGLGQAGLLRSGRSLGSLDAVGEASEVEIRSGRLSIGNPDSMLSKLEAMKVEMGLSGGSESWGNPPERAFLFSVQPSRIAADASGGILESGANEGITMQIFESPPREMLFRHPRVDLATGEMSATLSPLSMENPVTGPIATLDFRAAKQIQIRPRVGAFELLQIPAIANQFLADQLNQRFATGTFQAGEVFARVTLALSSPVE